jgi:Putative Actinobacterial Holin-X, holin superfamily III
MIARETSRPIMSLMTNVASDLAYLVQTEFRLARAEIGEKVSAASNAGAWLAAGAVFLLAGLIVLMFDISRWLNVAGMPPEWSLLVVALVGLAVGGVGAIIGMNRMKASTLVPNRAFEQMREDYVVAREHVR